MKNKRFLLMFIFIIMIFAIVLNSCSQADNDAGTSTVIIPLMESMNNSITRAPAVTDIDSYTLTITGPGMSAITETYPADTASIEIEVPSGDNREFSLLVNMNPDSSSAVLSWIGEAEADLPAEEVVPVTLDMGINETKIILPDFRNQRLVIINNINGDNMQTVIGNAAWGSGVWAGFGFQPYDVGIDRLGRIYIANYGSSMTGRVIRMDDFDATNFTEFTDQTIPILCLAIDNTNNYLYYSTSSTLYRVNLADNTESTRTTTGIQSFRGMSVDSNGTLYIAAQNSFGTPTIFKYYPDTQTIDPTTYTNGNFQVPWDTLVKEDENGNYLYVANCRNVASPVDLAIVRLNLDFTSPVEYGINESLASNTNKGVFYSPRRFVAVLNRKITIIDDNEYESAPTNFDKLISMDNIAGDNWETYPVSGGGQGLFRFYSTC